MFYFFQVKKKRQKDTEMGTHIVYNLPISFFMQVKIDGRKLKEIYRRASSNTRISAAGFEPKLGYGCYAEG